MGKSTGRMPKKGSSTNPEQNDISPDELHSHDWHFAREYRLDDYITKSKFVCLCGAVKRVKQFEVEE